MLGVYLIMHGITGQCGAIHFCINDTGVVTKVCEVGIGKDVQEQYAVVAHHHGQKEAKTRLVGCACTLRGTLEAPVELHNLFEIELPLNRVACAVVWSFLC